MNPYMKMVDEHQIHASLAEIFQLIENEKEAEKFPVESILRMEFILNNFNESIQVSDRLLISIDG